MIIKKIKHWSSVAGMTVKVFIEKCLFVTHSPPCAFIWFDFPVSVTRSSGFVICWSSKSSLNFIPNSTLITTLKESVAFFRKISFFLVPFAEPNSNARVLLLLGEDVVHFMSLSQYVEIPLRASALDPAGRKTQQTMCFLSSLKRNRWDER